MTIVSGTYTFEAISQALGIPPSEVPTLPSDLNIAVLGGGGEQKRISAANLELLKSFDPKRFMTFEAVSRRLKIDENRLRELVSEGEIRAFREGDWMKFMKIHVENFVMPDAWPPRDSPQFDASSERDEREEAYDETIVQESGGVRADAPGPAFKLLLIFLGSAALLAGIVWAFVKANDVASQ